MRALILATLCLGWTQEETNKIEVAAKKLAEAGSYSYRYAFRMNGGFDQGGRGRNSESKGRFHRETGLHVKLGDWGELFRQGESVYVKFGDRGWDKASSRGSEKDRKRRGRQSRSSWIKRIGPPHEEILRLSGGLKSVTQAEEGETVGDRECRLYTGTLTAEALNQGFVGRMLKRFGADQEAEVSGSVTGWLDDRDQLVRYRVKTTVGVKLQERDIEFSTERTVTFSHVGSTEVKAPEGLPE